MQNRLKELRKALGLTQARLAQELETTAAVISEWERVSLPRARILQICARFHVRRAWLEHGEGEMFEPKPPAPSLADYTDEELHLEEMKRLFEKLPEPLKLRFKQYCDKLRNE